MADSDRIAGTVTSFVGKAEKAAGNVTGDLSTAASGAGTEAEGALQNAAGQIKDAARGMADNLADAGSAAYGQGSELVAKSPGSALLTAGIIGFALGVILTKGSQSPRDSLQRYYDRYNR